MRKLTSLALLALLVAAAGYAARRFLGARENEWQTVGASPSPAATAAPAPEPADLAEPADLYAVADDGASGGDGSGPDGGATRSKPFDPLTDPLPDDLD